MRRRALAAQVLSLVLVLGLATACGDAGHGDTGRDDASGVDGAAAAALPVAPHVLRLWGADGLAPVVVERPQPGDDPGRIWFASLFDGEQLWYRASETPGGGAAFSEWRPDGGEVRLTTADRWGLCAAGPVAGGQALSLRLGLRPEHYQGPARSMLVAVVVELEQPFDPAASLDQQQLVDLLDERKSASRLIVAEVGGERLALREDFVTDPSTVAVAVYLLAPKAERRCELVFESVRVRSLSLTEHVASGGDVHGVVRRDDGSLAVQLDRDERRALPATAPSRTVFELPACAEPRTLELSLGVMPRHGDGGDRLRFVVRAAGQALLDETWGPPASLSEPAWHDRLLPLPASPDGPLTLELVSEAVGDDPPLGYFGHPSVLRAGPRERPNVLLISLDTLRPDRLGCYGHDEPSLSPTLDALAAEGLRWSAAYSTSSYTLPSHASMLTGQFPAFHGAVDVLDQIDPQRSPLLADLLAQAGYSTAGFTGGGYVSTTYGFGEGFDRYSHNDPVWALDTVRGAMLMQTMSWERSPIRPELLERYDAGAIERWIGSRPEGVPFFLFAHTYIVHNYAPDLAGLERMQLLGKPGDSAWQQPFNHRDRERFNRGEALEVDAIVAQYLPYYDGTIGMADAFVARLLAALDAAGVADDTLVVVTSDHGEEFGEHGFFGHGETLYDANTRVPLIARLPADRRGAGPRVISEPVSLADVAPWILSVAGLEPHAGMAVRPPLGPSQLDPPARGPGDLLVMELDNRVDRISAVRQGALKLTVHLGADGHDFEQELVELYDLADDPLETRDLAGQRAPDQERLRQLLRRFHDLAGALHPRDGLTVDLDSLDPEMLQQLKALGYLGGPDDSAADGVAGQR